MAKVSASIQHVRRKWSWSAILPRLWTALLAVDRIYLWSALIGTVTAAILIELASVLRTDSRPW